jgi:hypothetical protein
VPADKKPVVFISHGTPDQTSWLETIADVAVIPTEDGLFSTENLKYF